MIFEKSHTQQWVMLDPPFFDEQEMTFNYAKNHVRSQVSTSNNYCLSQGWKKIRPKTLNPILAPCVKEPSEVMNVTCTKQSCYKYSTKLPMERLCLVNNKSHTNWKAFQRGLSKGSDSRVISNKAQGWCNFIFPTVIFHAIARTTCKNSSEHIAFLLHKTMNIVQLRENGGKSVTVLSPGKGDTSYRRGWMMKV